MQISIRKLNYLVAAARLGKLSSAAAQLNVSQPALSRAIAELEAHYGIRIFERGRFGVRPTAAGEQIVLEAEHILRSTSAFDRKFQLVGKGEAGFVAVGMGSIISGMFLPGLAKHVFSSFPNGELSTLIRPADALVEALLESTIEMFFAPQDDRPAHESIQIVKLGQFSLKIFARRDHPIFMVPEPTLRDIAAFPVACAMEVPWIRALNPNSGTFTCDNFHIVKSVVIDSDLIWFCPAKFIAAEAADGFRSIEVSIPAPTEYPIVCGTLKNRASSPLGTKIIEYMQGAVKNLTE